MPQATSVADLLEHLIGGGTITSAELAAAAWDDIEDDQLKTDAWHSAQHWIADEDIRTRDADYEQMARERIAYIREQLLAANTSAPAQPGPRRIRQ